MLILIWCVYCFCTAGFEHSIANMTVMAVGLIAPNGVEGISLAGYVHNLLWVTLGNMVGGISVALAYYTISRKK